jgi:predicted outer membrane protein
MTIRMLLAAAATLALLGSGVAYAQTPAPAPDKPAAATKAKPARSAKSLECSKQADAKGLHGKERKKFRSECKRGAT